MINTPELGAVRTAFFPGDSLPYYATKMAYTVI